MLVCKIPTCAKHASDIGVSFVEAFVDDGVDEGASVEEHSLVGTGARISGGVFLAHFLLAVVVSLPQTTVPDLLYFHDVITREQPA